MKTYNERVRRGSGAFFMSFVRLREGALQTRAGRIG
jgi:hypothetical protein